MINASYCSTMAEYNRWMNERIYELCSTIPDAEHKRDRGAFFASIHGTLKHILYGDLAFLSRFTGDPPEVSELEETLYEDFDELRGVRAELDQRIVTWGASLTDE